ncbi:Type IIB DNA topoisomerase, putative [Angomonas deanei]|uniref:DNA topoisomerase (ATP-hydrolyzing) n=1 Tax=Angomonas deanei TaxID=59799 RepID=A0A7G2BZ29_9TRYP|nr:Type IIB DNA topoisomerase, putative [Angomonas deanei]
MKRSRPFNPNTSLSLSKATFAKESEPLHFSKNTLYDKEDVLKRIEAYVLVILKSINDTYKAREQLTETRQTANVRNTKALVEYRNELVIIDLLYKNAMEGVVSAHRDIYYHLIRKIPHQNVVNHTVMRLTTLLGIPRESLGVLAGTRGTVGGTLSFRGTALYDASRRLRSEEDTRSGVDGCAEGVTIPSTEECLSVTTEAGVASSPSAKFVLSSRTRFIIVVEKHAIFFRLMSERIYDKIPCVLLTSHGFPTLAARRLLLNMHRAAPHIPVVGLVDYNPSGLAILLQYKFGNERVTVDEGVAAVRWLGLRGHHISGSDNPESTPDTSRAFTSRDTAMTASLSDRLNQKATREGEYAPWLAEIEKMKKSSRKYEIEEVYRAEGNAVAPRSLSEWLCSCLLRRDYI